MFRIGIVTITLALCAPILADATFFYTDFQTLPEGWIADPEWNFGGYGAVLNLVSSDWDTTLRSWDDDAGAVYFVPDGTDSIHVEIPWSLYVSNVEGICHFYIYVYSLSGAFHKVFDKSVGTNPFNSNGVVDVYYDDIGGGDFVAIWVSGNGWAEVGGSCNLNWKIHEITLTAIGDDLALSPLTWAGIKTTFMD